MFAQEVKEHLVHRLIPFWEGMRDERFGGYYGWKGFDLETDKEAVKGCILNSRILWFFSNCYLLLGEAKLLEHAKLRLGQPHAVEKVPAANGRAFAQFK